MTHLSLPSSAMPVSSSLCGPGAVLAEALRRQPALAGTGLLLVAAMAPTLFAYAVETRTLYGINVWAKPLKFQASLGLYLLTLAWFWAYLPAAARARRWVAAFPAVLAAIALFEVGYISLQAGRGVGSHFNIATPLEEWMFRLMGIGALILTGGSLVLGLLLARSGAPGLSPTFRRGVIWGLVLTFVLGVSSGLVIVFNQQHWVGGTLSDAGGFPIFGWSRDGGDLRVAHFFGLHAMQILPAFALAAERVAARSARAAVAAATLALVALTAATCVQALAGRPFLPMLG
jgi:hypothetical protein